MKKSLIFSPLIISSLLLAGCINNTFSDELEKTKSSKAEKETTESKEEKKKQKEEKERYKELEKPLDQVVQENELDAVKTMPTKEIKAKESFEDENEFAMYTADILYKFYTLQITPEDYYTFLHTYGSESVQQDLPSKTDAISILGTLQSMYKSQNIQGESFIITEVSLGRLKREAFFYRKLLTTKGEEYFITTIVKENNEWRYVEDSPSPPFEEDSNQTKQPPKDEINVEPTTNENDEKE